MSARSDHFVELWTMSNVNGITGQDDYSAEVDDCAYRIVHDAAAAGIDAKELAETLPDIPSYFVQQYELVCDPDRYY